MIKADLVKQKRYHDGTILTAEFSGDEQILVEKLNNLFNLLMRKSWLVYLPVIGTLSDQIADIQKQVIFNNNAISELKRGKLFFVIDKDIRQQIKMIECQNQKLFTKQITLQNRLEKYKYNQETPSLRFSEAVDILQQLGFVPNTTQLDTENIVLSLVQFICYSNNYISLAEQIGTITKSYEHIIEKEAQYRVKEELAFSIIEDNKLSINKTETAEQDYNK